MTTARISELNPVTAAKLADLFETVQDGVSSRVSLEQINALLSDNPVCDLATTANLTATYENGTDGVGATLTNAGALAALTIDGVAVSLDDIILVKDQSTTFENGIYIVRNFGDALNPWILQRTTYYDEAVEILAGDFFTIGLGTANAKTQYIQTESVADIGVDAILFESNVTAGLNLVKTNNELSVDPNSVFNSIATKILSIEEGANFRMGVVTLVAGTFTVNNNAVTATSRIFLTTQLPGGTPGWLQVSARVPATSFTILSSDVADTSVVAWLIIDPA